MDFDSQKVRRLAIAIAVALAAASVVVPSGLTRARQHLIYDLISKLYRSLTPSDSERMAVVATGGYGRGLLAPGSDIDLLFLLPYKQTAWGESVAEAILYCLWDMGLKVGHATRSVDECVRLAKADMTIRTAVLESRYLECTLPCRTFPRKLETFSSELLRCSVRAVA